MTKREARNILLPYNISEIREVYDLPNVQQAILTIKPNFEYPDWSERLVASFLVKTS